MKISSRLRLAASCILTLAWLINCGSEQPRETAASEPLPSDKNLYWGDLHNHNSIGQIRGSLERTFEIAQSHLDFFAFTPQSQWPDMRQIPEGRNAQFVRGFNAVKANWERIQELASEYHEPGRFVPLIGYEVHFNEGDFHILYPGESGKLVSFDDIKEWQRFAKETGAILVPHHPGYLPGWRGWDWARLDPEVSPVVEMMSEHGNAEWDRAPIRYLRHSMGGRYTRSTVQWLWQSGARVGVVASTDDHLGHPGAYGQGLAAVHADSLDRESIMEALKARRSYAVNADRIELDFRLNGRWMGEEIPFAAERTVQVRVKGEDVIDRVEVLKNDRVFHRDHPIDREPADDRWSKPVLCRIEFGWGPWADFNMPRTFDWEFTVAVNGGRIVSASPHFQSRPFDEERRNRVRRLDDGSWQVVSHTSREKAYEEKPTNDLVVAIEGSPETEVVLTFQRPEDLTFRKSLAELAESSEILFTGEFSSESVMLHRLVFADRYVTEFTVRDTAREKQADRYRVRVFQTNGSMAWSSPIWVGGE